MNELTLVDPNILVLDSNSLTNLLLYGQKSFAHEINSRIIEISIKFIKDTKRFEGPLF